MERLTERDPAGNAYFPECFKEPCGGGGCTKDHCEFFDQVCDKMAGYEEQGEQAEKLLAESEAARADLGKRLAAAQKKLAAYKDTGLEPEEIKNALDVNDIMPEINVTVDRLLELIQAEQDGRLIVLPCKVGDTVYRVLTTRDCPPVLSEVKIKTVGQAADLIVRMGKRKLLSYYLTREEAETALEGGRDE